MAIPTDTLLGSQWHLINTGGGLDINLADVWEEGWTGDGVGMAFLVDGVDYGHPDLVNFDTGLDGDAVDSDDDSAPELPGENWGTAVLGTATGAVDGFGTVGVAYGALNTALRIGTTIDDLWVENVALGSYYAAFFLPADVVTIASSATSDETTMFGNGLDFGGLISYRIDFFDIVYNGRYGLGTIIVKAAGDARADGFDLNADLTGNDTQMINVAGIGADGFVTATSNYGSSLLVSAFGDNVFAADRLGADGFDGGDFAYADGTELAAAMVSGVVALLLEAHPDLGWRDIQDILAASARHVGSAIGAGPSGNEVDAWMFNGAETWNGGGMHFSRDYGFGLVDATAALRLAETWHYSHDIQDSFNEWYEVAEIELLTDLVIPDGDVGGTSITATITDAIVAERIQLGLTDFEIEIASDFAITITSPSGTTDTLLYRPGLGGSGDGISFAGQWLFESQAFRGENAVGDWTITFFDLGAGGASTIFIDPLDPDIDFAVNGYDAAFDPTRRFVFTDEYSDYAGGPSGHVTSFAGDEYDIINAAAVTSGSVILLGGGSSSVDGVTVTFTGFYDAAGGVGDDVIRGNGLDNYLYGGRGDDTIEGGADDDELYGDDGSDTLSFASASTAVTVSLLTGLASGTSSGFDIFESFENVEGGTGGDDITGDNGANRLDGAGGADELDGGKGDDILIGGLGADTMIGGSGIDTVSYAAATAAVTVNLGLAQNNATGAHGIDQISGVENILGGTGADSLTGNNADNHIDGGTGTTADTLNGAEGDDTLVGRAGDDILNGGAGTDTAVFAGLRAAYTFGNYVNGVLTVTGPDGTDTLTSISLLQFDDQTVKLVVPGVVRPGTAAAEAILGSDGNDQLRGQGGNDQIRGYDGDDDGNAGAHDDTAYMGAGDDRMYGSHGDDLLYGQDGADRLIGDAGADLLDGGDENDRLYGGSGNDTIDGGSGHDFIDGSGGDDTITGGSGDDRLQGRGGADTFNFLPNSGADRIFGFEDDVDTIRISSAYGFADAGAVVGSTAVAGGHLVIDLGNGNQINLWLAATNGMTAADLADDIIIF